MAVDKLVDSTQLNTDLTSVANAIRTKGGTSAQLAFPAGFVSAVQNIPTGTTPTGTKSISITANGTTTEDVAAYANAEINVNVQGGGDLIPRLENTLVSYESDALTKLHEYAFYNCSALTTFKAHNVTSIGSNVFVGTHVVTLAFPKINGGATWWTIFSNAKFLETVDVNAPPSFWNRTFGGCTAFNTLIIRKTDSIVTLNAINVFENTPFASGGTGGTLYVHASLVTEYTQGTNWSTILGYTNNQIKSIESTHTDPTAPIDLTLYYADGTPIT